VISGPSFLGLNDPPPRKRSSLGLDADSGRSGSSGNLDYLLEDEEEPKHGSATKFILIAVALALVAGLGYLGWKNQGFGWLSPGGSKPATATQPTDAADSNAPAPTNDSPSPSSSASSNPSPPAQPAPTQTAPDSAASTPSAASNSASDPSGNAPSGNVSPATNQPATSTSPVGKKPAGKNDEDSDATSATAPAPHAAKPRPVPADVPAKPSPARVADPVAEAQKYIYGKGVRQDCDHGLHLLKPAADHANPKAMIEMGALYSAGLCTPRDLPTAYRWFALALRKDPANASVQTDLQKLWGEMTQPERQLAIRLSQ
jgi:hypothetical protein